MPEQFKQLTPPRGISRLLFRLPILLYRMGLGGLLGKRFLLLEHRGRLTGSIRRSVLEVVWHEAACGEFVVAVGFGPSSDWYRNLLQDPVASITVGLRRIAVRAAVISPDRRGLILEAFARQHPTEARFIRLLGFEVDGSAEDWRALGELLILVSLMPLPGEAVEG